MIILMKAVISSIGTGKIRRDSVAFVEVIKKFRSGLLRNFLFLGGESL